MGSSYAKLSEMELDFLQQNTKFSRKQIIKWHRNFMKECPSGQLSRDQFIRVYGGFFQRGDVDEFCGHVFRTFDTDNSGTVDFKEFLFAINVTSHGTAEEKLEYAFRMYDIDNNKAIEERELIKILEAIYEILGDTEKTVGLTSGQLARQRARQIFARLDSNNDKKVTLEEFVNGCMSDKEIFNLLASVKS